MFGAPVVGCRAPDQSAELQVPEASGSAGLPVLVVGVLSCATRKGCSRDSTSSPVPHCYTERSQGRG